MLTIHIIYIKQLKLKNYDYICGWKIINEENGFQNLIREIEKLKL